MTDIKVSVPDEIFKKMKKYPKIDWGSVALSAVEKYLENLQISDKIASKSTLTMEDAEIIGEELKKRSWEIHKKYLEQL